jgi:CheY-like chemotaxis protein
MTYSLEQAGYRVSSAATAEDALAIVGCDRPDLVLLDIGLPGMDGLDALQRLRSQMGVPAIFDRIAESFWTNVRSAAGTPLTAGLSGIPRLARRRSS